LTDQQPKGPWNWLAQQVATNTFQLLFTAGIGVLSLGGFAGLFAIFVGPALYVSAALLLALAASWGLFVWLYRRGRSRRSARLVHLARTMLSAATGLTDFLATSPTSADRDRFLQSAIESVLRDACSFVAYRVHQQHKCANLLILKGDEADAGFTEPATYNMDPPALQVTEYLRRDNSLAGLAITRMEPVVVANSRKPPKDLTWFPHLKTTPFIGWVCAPVYAGLKPIGALTMGMDRVWDCSQEDKEMLTIFAERLGHLWSLREQAAPASAATQQTALPPAESRSALLPPA
jgi:hypothetical protein